jgi:D-methionine transport system substrate-binding protein
MNVINNRRFNLLVVFSIILFAIIGCDPKPINENDILIGTIAGPETELVEVAKEVALKKYNLNVNIVPFNDYVEPNRALAEGEINVNMFQHQPYLDQVVEKQKLPLVSIGKLFIYPMGIYSEKHKSFDAIPRNAVVAVPNDVSNQSRSLLLLAKANLITLKENVDSNSYGIGDIATNPKNLKFEEVDPAFMVRMLPDLDLAIINTNYAAMARLLPNRDALIAEDRESRYANILVVRAEDKDKEQFKQLIEAFHSEEVINKAQKLFNNQAIIAW